MPFDIAGHEEAIRRLEALTLEPGFWEDRERQVQVLQELGDHREQVEKYGELVRAHEDLEVLLDLAAQEGDQDTVAEVQEGLKELARRVEAAELAVLLSGPYDGHDAILSLHAGAGGTEAQDWVEMLLRMYTRWAEAHGYKVTLLDLLPGDEAGIKSVTLEVSGRNAYGYLRAEKGVHRLVRISPFDAAARRHTSFASVEVLPEVEDEARIEIRPEDLRIDTFRSGGAGGQHVNKTESAVRITHLPTGIVVTCQNERSQMANRLTAMKLLRAKLLDLELRKREEQLAILRGEQREIAWGSQIRSYVFHPYRLVKDHRTGVETGDVEAVMDGDLDPFIGAYLRREATRNKMAQAGMKARVVE
jgi:peptide chain release factor 2